MCCCLEEDPPTRSSYAVRKTKCFIHTCVVEVRWRYHEAAFIATGVSISEYLVDWGGKGFIPLVLFLVSKSLPFFHTAMPDGKFTFSEGGIHLWCCSDCERRGKHSLFHNIRSCSDARHFSRVPTICLSLPIAAVAREVLHRIHLADFHSVPCKGVTREPEHSWKPSALPACQAISHIEPFSSVEDMRSWQAGQVTLFTSAVELDPHIISKLRSFVFGGLQ